MVGVGRGWRAAQRNELMGDDKQAAERRGSHRRQQVAAPALREGSCCVLDIMYRLHALEHRDLATKARCSSLLCPDSALHPSACPQHSPHLQKRDSV